MLIIILKFIVSAGICIYLFLRVTAYRKSFRKLISNVPKAEEPLYRQQLEKDLHHALENEEFFLVYQPQVDVPRQKIVGAEALLRWEHPTFGMISPEIFIPILEETGLICPIGEWVLLSACRQLNKWEEHLTSAIRISVNLSVRQLMMDDIPSILSGIIRETSVDPHRLELEITESGFLTHTESMIAAVESIKATGVSIAIDDFGSGQSSLSYFKYFPIDTLKVDRIFIREMISSNCDQAIVSSLIFLAHNLGMKVIAEGVERMEELELLSDYKCDEVQGFLYSRPLTVRDFEDLLASEGIFDYDLVLQ
ncbi:bifunctional diguanylate cyclase/phosphodiesterase [Paenibacillus sp. IHB B 3415]|uniref:putative bifunctional diguanylate cyclase/phosphodiesterase n=1 Tax=Paenibacillus sp. IHB B 3415 TaxID=867080 RepID=UPI00069BAAC2|nr:EAL domain-containing protein [Paenibacillus sp. IHB B 3415]